MNYILMFLFLIIPQLVFGAGGGGGIPYFLVFSQALNLGLLLTILFFLCRNIVKNHIRSRKENYEKMFSETKVKYEKLDKERKDLIGKIESFDEDKNKEQALKEASTYTENLKQQTKKDIDKMKQNATQFIEQLKTKLSVKLKKHMIEEVLNKTSNISSKNVSLDLESWKKS